MIQVEENLDFFHDATISHDPVKISYPTQENPSRKRRSSSIEIKLETETPTFADVKMTFPDSIGRGAI
jgi:hypothetical protein